MEVIEILKNAKNQIENNKNEIINKAIEENNVKVVMPQITKIEQATQEAIEAIQLKCQHDIAAARELGENKKQEFIKKENEIITTKISSQFESSLNDLNKIISKLES